MGFEESLRRFDERRNALLNEMQQADAQAISARPRAGKWSMLEIIEHLVLAERSVYRGLPAPESLTAKERTAGDRLRCALVFVVLRSRIPVSVPSAAMLPRGGRSLAELRLLWDENQRWLRSTIEHLGPDGLGGAVFVHPIAGPLTVGQAIRLGRIHFDLHLRQIRALQRLLTCR